MMLGNGFVPQKSVAGDQTMPQDNTDYSVILQHLRKLMQGVGFGGNLASVISRLAGIGGNGSSFDGGTDQAGGGSGGGPTGPTGFGSDIGSGGL